MRRFIRATFVIVSAAAVLTATGLTALAQSGSRTPPAKPSTKAIPPAETTQRAPQQLPVAMEGYCPVCILELKKWVEGTADHTVVYDGRTYRFPGEKQVKMFLANPEKYKALAPIEKPPAKGSGSR